jgi:prepilin-type N-terminal cleavage/methylation domain-containing protein
MRLQYTAPSRGFTLVEVLVAMTLTGILVAGTLQALTAQKRFYARQSRILDARHAMRASTTILSSELREASATGGDLYAIASDSVALRSTVGFGVACSVTVGANSVISLTHVSGHFNTTAGDSVLVFVENGPSNSDDAWQAFLVSSITTSGPDCASGRALERAVTVAGDLTGVWVGAPVRLFRSYAFGLFEADDRWWLGRRDRSPGFDYVPVAGPLAPPAEGGLQLTYYGPGNVQTWNRFEVVRVDISVRAPTYRSLTDPGYQSLSTGTYLRNDG